MDQYEDYITQGLHTFDSFASTIAEKLDHAALLAKQKAEEAGVAEKIQGTASSLTQNLSYFG